MTEANSESGDPWLHKFDHLPTSALIQHLDSPAIFPRLYALEALVLRTSSDSALLDYVIAAIRAPKNRDARIMQMSVAYFGVAALLRLGSPAALAAAAHVIDNWSGQEEDRSDLFDYLQSEQLLASVWKAAPITQLLRWWCRFTIRVEKGVVGPLQAYAHDLQVRSWIDQRMNEADPRMNAVDATHLLECDARFHAATRAVVHPVIAPGTEPEILPAWFYRVPNILAEYVLSHHAEGWDAYFRDVR